MKKIYSLLLMVLLISFIGIGNEAYANKTTVKINAPEKAEKGTEVVVTIEVTHNGNTRFHYTDWVSLKVNGEEVKKWEYTKKERPDSEDFTLEYKFIIKEETTIEAKGNCNMHGSTGVEKVTIQLK